MALYINDPDICKLALSPFGIQSIKKFITDKDGEEPIFEKKMTISGFGYNLLTRCWSSSDGVNFKKDEKKLSNTLMVTGVQIVINPTMNKNRENYTNELTYFIESLPQLARDYKIENILNERD
jgi:hypothetical protein